MDEEPRGGGGRQTIYKETWAQTEGTKVNLLGSSRGKAKGKKNDIEMGHKQLGTRRYGTVWMRE